MTIEEILSVILAGLPTVIIGAVWIALMIGVRRLLARGHTDLGHSGVFGQLLMVSLAAIGLILVVLTLPIGETTQGQLLNLFGLLVTAAIALSSTTFIGNAMAGLMLRAVRHVRPGDFLTVEDHFGRVSEQGLLHTEIQTERRDLTTLPNLYLVNNPVTVVRSSGTFVFAEVSLGYDVQRKDIEKYLLDAVDKADLTDGYVHITELGDHSVNYRVAGFLSDVKRLLTVRSRLRAAMLDVLHERGVEIVSPRFVNQRVLPLEQIFIPRHKATVPPSLGQPEETDPEARIFDKAEEAESKAEITEELKDLAVRADELKKEVDKADDEHAKAAAERELKTIEDAKVELSETLDEMAKDDES